MRSERIALLSQFRGIYLTDCSRFTWGAFGFKLGVRWDMQSGQLEIEVMSLNSNDQKTQVVEAPMPEAALHLGDLGFFKLKRFAQWNVKGIKWLSRFKVGTKVFTTDDQAIDVAKWLASCNQEVCIPIIMGIQTPVSCFLVAAPLPEDAKIKRQARLKEEARRDQRPISKQKQALAAFTIYVTNMEGLTFPQAHTLARMRWQIYSLNLVYMGHDASCPYRRNFISVLLNTNYS